MCLIDLHSFICSALIMPSWTPLLNQLIAIIAFDNHFKSFIVALSFANIFKNYKKLLHFSLQLGEDSCVSGNSKATLFYQNIILPPKNVLVWHWSWLNYTMWQTKISNYFSIWEVLWNGCRYRKGLFGLGWDHKILMEIGVYFK